MSGIDEHILFLYTIGIKSDFDFTRRSMTMHSNFRKFIKVKTNFRAAIGHSIH